MKSLLQWFSLTGIWVLGLDPGGRHPSHTPAAARMGDIRLTDLLPHLPHVPVVLLVRILQEI